MVRWYGYKHNKRVHRLFYTYPDDYVDGDNRQKSERNSKESFVYSAPSDVSILFKATSSSTQSCRLIRHGRTMGGFFIKWWMVVKERAIPKMRRDLRGNVRVWVSIIGYNRDGAKCWRRFLRNKNPVSVRDKEAIKLEANGFTQTEISRWASRSPSSIGLVRSPSWKLVRLCSCERDLIEAEPITLPCQESSERARCPVVIRPTISVGVIPYTVFGKW